MTELLQGGLFTGYAVLLAAALIVGGRRRRLCPLAFAVGVVALPHALFYAEFLWFPAFLDGYQTMLFSLMLRYQVLGVAVLVLAMAVIRDRWRT